MDIYRTQNNGDVIDVVTECRGDDSSGTGTLTRIESGKKTKIAEDVTIDWVESWVEYTPWENGSYMYLCNESSDGCKHDLYKWTDGKAVYLDFDVQGFVFPMNRWENVYWW
ncbi:MAG: hypothetical protein ACI4I5_06305 [Acutalibacteraceae bacterium]